MDAGVGWLALARRVLVLGASEVVFVVGVVVVVGGGGGVVVVLLGGARRRQATYVGWQRSSGRLRIVNEEAPSLHMIKTKELLRRQGPNAGAPSALIF